MKKYSILAIVLILVDQAHVSGQDSVKPIQKVSISYMNRNITYNNPLPIAISDPYVLMDKDSTYYMYGTNGGGPRSARSPLVYRVYSSKDLVNWRYEGKALSVDTNKSWWQRHVLGAFLDIVWIKHLT